MVSINNATWIFRLAKAYEDLNEDNYQTEIDETLKASAENERKTRSVEENKNKKLYEISFPAKNTDKG